MKLRLPRRRIARAAIYLVSLFLIVIAADLVLVQVRRTIHPGFDTTRIIAPTMPDGSIDYLSTVEDYFSRGVAPENNAAIPILQALGRAALPKNQPVNGITDRLGMPPLPDTGDYYITFDQYFRQHPADDVSPDQAMEGTITLKPEMAQWVQANKKPLALFTEASKRSRYFIPFNGGNRPSVMISVLIPQVNLLSDARWALLTRALIRLNGGDISGFQDDIHTAHRLARLLGQDSTIVGRLVGVALERSTCRLERFAIASGKLSSQNLRDMLADLDAVGDVPTMTDCIDFGERFMGLDLMQAMARSSPAGRAELFNGILGRSEPAVLFWFLPIPYAQCMRNLNHFYDGEIVVMRQPTYPMRVQAWNLFNQDVTQISSDSRVMRFVEAKWAVQALLPALMACNTKVDLAQTDYQLTQIALALSLFKSDHGTYPATLSELAPQYLPTVPDDLFTDQPMKYSRVKNGYMLYSVGPNMIDDGGKTTKPGDDIDADEIIRTFSSPGATLSPATRN